MLKNTVLTLIFLFVSLVAFTQCEILNRVSPNGSMIYYIEPVNFYYTKAKSLTGGIVTDKESFFLELLPVPFPEKPAGTKLTDDLQLKLSDGSALSLSHYDTRYIRKDTVMKMVFLIGEKDLELLRKFEVNEAKINMGEKEGIRTYVFKLHKNALKMQLECFLKEEEVKKK